MNASTSLRSALKTDDYLKRAYRVPVPVGERIDWGLAGDDWFGICIGSQKDADRCFEPFYQTKASNRFVTVDPLLEKITIEKYINKGVDWVILNTTCLTRVVPRLEWFRLIISECDGGNVPVFVVSLSREVIDGKYNTVTRHADRSGRDMAEWPEDLRRREIPEDF